MENRVLYYPPPRAEIVSRLANGLRMLLTKFEAAYWLLATHIILTSHQAKGNLLDSADIIVLAVKA